MANTQNLDLVKPLGTDHALVSVLNSNSDKIDAYAGAVNAGLDGLRDGLGILANGNTHAAITSGQYVYVKNHGSLPEGLYKATANIAANGTLSTSNLAADSAGGLNSLNEQIGTLETPVRINQSDFLTLTSGFTINEFYAFKLGKIVNASITVSIDSGYIQYGHIPFEIKSPYIPKIDVIRNAPYRGGSFSITADGRLWIYPTGNTDINFICWLEYITV